MRVERIWLILTKYASTSVSGLVLMGYLQIYIFLEIASITAYILTSLNRDKKGYMGLSDI